MARLRSWMRRTGFSGPDSPHGWNVRLEASNRKSKPGNGLRGWKICRLGSLVVFGLSRVGRPVFDRRLLVRGSGAPGVLSGKAFVRVRGCPGLSRMLLKYARMCHWSLWHQEGLSESHIGYLLMLR
ncbi:hypothetical protein CRG98_030016 [Punica granatum]|uniref:Uncharacterized protein n=1 Tax=Punica granatum TaxID=22663 RepID=A0A2I0J0Q8_PUNGR|nr:hypothetical protein CRG98_030016 [Punica granatum]